MNKLSEGRRTGGISHTDIGFEDHGSVCLLRPATDAARTWLTAHTDPEATWFGTALVVEPRYVADLVNGAREDGLVVRRG